MGREHTIEAGTNRPTSRVQPAFQLVGTPGTNKSKVANKLAADYFTQKLSVWGESSLWPQFSATGFFADYRAEMLVAARRSTRLHTSDMATIYTHSLIDSLSYSLIRLDTQVNSGASEKTLETWALTMGLIGCMFRDTFKADEIFFLMADFDPETDQAKIQETLGFVLDGYEVSYTILDADSETVVDDIATVIKSYILA